MFRQANGKITPSFCSRNLEEMDKTGNLAEQESDIKSTAGQMYIGT
jgi:hypothetical protein